MFVGFSTKINSSEESQLQLHVRPTSIGYVTHLRASTTKHYVYSTWANCGIKQCPTVEVIMAEVDTTEAATTEATAAAEVAAMTVANTAAMAALR